MMILFRGCEVFAPEPLGRKDVLVAPAAGGVFAGGWCRLIQINGAVFPQRLNQDAVLPDQSHGQSKVAGCRGLCKMLQ